MPAKKAAAKVEPESSDKKDNDSAPPSKPIESPQVSENNRNQAPPVDEKNADEDTEKAPKSEPRSNTTKTDSAKEEKLSVDEVGAMIDAGSRQWGTGRDVDTNLLAQGYDLYEVRAAVTKARSKRLGG